MRPPKKQKVLEPATKDENTHVAFQEWARSRGVQINGVEATHVQDAGYGLIAKRKLKKEELLIFVPEKAMFQPKHARLKTAIKKMSPQAQLVMSLIVSLHDNDPGMSKWTATWPSDVDLPMFWPERLQQLLPPSVLPPIERMRKDYAEDWQTCRAMCEELNLTEGYFQHHWSIVNSRSFHWKPFGVKEGAMVMCPYMDYINHAPSGGGCMVQMSWKGYEVVADRNYGVGEEIYATYGAHSNDKLLVHYGFVCASDSPETNKDDEIRLDDVLIAKMTPDQRSQLQDVGFLGGYALLPATNDLCYKTQVAVRSLLLTSNEWEHFMSSGEDLGKDMSNAVAAYVRPLLEAYGEQANARIAEIDKVADFGLVDGTLPERDLVRYKILRGRWSQISDAIKRYIEAHGD